MSTKSYKERKINALNDVLHRELSLINLFEKLMGLLHGSRPKKGEFGSGFYGEYTKKSILEGYPPTVGKIGFSVSSIRDLQQEDYRSMYKTLSARFSRFKINSELVILNITEALEKDEVEDFKNITCSLANSLTVNDLIFMSKYIAPREILEIIYGRNALENFDLDVIPNNNENE